MFVGGVEVLLVFWLEGNKVWLTDTDCWFASIEHLLESEKDSEEMLTNRAETTNRK